MSVYNDIYIGNSEENIVIDCSPDQFSSDIVRIDREDYDKIKELANKMGWENAN